MVTIHVQPEDLVKFWLEKGDELDKNYLLLAEDTRDNIQIYLSEEGNVVSLTVWHNDEIEHEEKVTVTYKETRLDELQEEYERMVHFYFDEEEYDEDSPFSEEEQDRLDNITAAAEDFFTVLMEASPNEVCLEEEDMADLIYRVEKTLFDDYGITCWHPTMVDAFTVISYPFGDSSELDDQELDPDPDGDMAGTD